MCESPAVAGMTDVVIGLQGRQGWVPACAGMTVMQVPRFGGNTMALRRPHKGMRMGAAAPAFGPEPKAGMGSRLRGNDGCGDRVAGGSRLGSRLRGNDDFARVSLRGSDGYAVCRAATGRRVVFGRKVK